MYYAITRRNDHWEYVCSGQDPQEVYREAIDLIDIPLTASLAEEEFGSYTPPGSERLLDTLRVVPEETARERYHVSYTEQYAGGE